MRRAAAASSTVLQTSQLLSKATHAALLPICTKFRPNPSKLSSRTTADLHQPPFRATAAVCRRPLGRRTDPNGRKLTILERFSHPKLLGNNGCLNLDFASEESLEPDAGVDLDFSSGTLSFTKASGGGADDDSFDC